MARLTFQNVPTKSGGVVSGNISTGAGSPFGAGGKFEAQVSHIQAEIAKAPEGFYDPVGWEAFVSKDEIFINPTELNEVETLQRELERRSNYANKHYTGGAWENHLIWKKQREAEIKILKDKIKQDVVLGFEEHKRQLKIDQEKKLALEQKIRETATLREKERLGEVPTSIDIILQQINALKERKPQPAPVYGVGVESSKILQLQKQIQEKKKYGASFGTGHPHLKIIAQQIQKLQAEIIAEQKAIKKVTIIEQKPTPATPTPEPMPIPSSTITILPIIIIAVIVGIFLLRRRA